MRRGTSGFWLNEKDDGSISIGYEDYDVSEFGGSDYEQTYNLDSENALKLKFMTMQTLTPIVLQELIDKIDVFPIEGTGKNRTQRLVIHYRFVGCIDLPSIVPKHTYKLDSRQGVAIEYLPSAV